jgi:L-2-hydroxycarboxylate dehydrogenase (NAD+)
MKRNHYSGADVYLFSMEVLKKGGYQKPGYAEATTRALLEADKRGIFSHGIAGGTGLEEAVKKVGITATVEVDAEPRVIETRYPGITVIDANGSPGHYSSQLAVEILKDKARKNGIAKVFVNNANHFGAAGVWSDMIAEDYDLEGVVTCTTAACARVLGDDPNRIDYTKGAGNEPRMGTNPESISIPYERDGIRDILTFDSANTKMAASLCIKSLKAGEMLNIPHYVADIDYESTLDPTRVFQTNEGKLKMVGTVFPLGSEHSGYKGDSKLRMIEIDNALGGGPYQRISIGDKGADRRISLTFMAQAVDFHFENAEQARKRVGQVMEDIEKYFGENSRWPGDRSIVAMEYQRENGIPYSTGQVDTLKRAAEHVGLPFALEPVDYKDYPEDIFNK